MARAPHTRAKKHGYSRTGNRAGPNSSGSSTLRENSRGEEGVTASAQADPDTARPHRGPCRRRTDPSTVRTSRRGAAAGRKPAASGPRPHRPQILAAPQQTAVLDHPNHQPRPGRTHPSSDLLRVKMEKAQYRITVGMRCRNAESDRGKAVASSGEFGGEHRRPAIRPSLPFPRHSVASAIRSLPCACSSQEPAAALAQL